MGLAICIRCGNGKERAFSVCGGCGYDPAANDTDREAQARSLLLSDAHLSRAELEDIARTLRAGRPYPVDPARLEALMHQLSTQAVPVLAPRRGVVLAVWVPVAVLGLALATGVALAVLRSRS